jgi:hypothetical protein
LNFSLLFFQLGNIHLSWDLIINRIRLGGLIYKLESSLQLNMFQELQSFAFVCMYLDTSWVSLDIIVIIIIIIVVY